MSRWVLIPAKSFARAKTRLAPALGPADRIDLARALLTRALEVVGQVGLRALVVTDGDDVASLARSRGAEVLADPSDRRHLGDVVDAGLACLASRDIPAALVLMADLPQVTADDLRALLAVQGPLVVAPDEADAGTNALLITPPDRHLTAFGRSDSLARHVALGAQLVRRAGLARDVDVPGDLRFLGGPPPWPGALSAARSENAALR